MTAASKGYPFISLSLCLSYTKFSAYPFTHSSAYILSNKSSYPLSHTSAYIHIAAPHSDKAAPPRTISTVRMQTKKIIMTGWTLRRCLWTNPLEDTQESH